MIAARRSATGPEYDPTAWRAIHAPSATSESTSTAYTLICSSLSGEVLWRPRPEHVGGRAPRAPAAELLPPVRVGEVGGDLVDVVRPADQPALLVVEREIEVARVHELGDNTVDRPVELLQVAGCAGQLGDPVQGPLHLAGIWAGGPAS